MEDQFRPVPHKMRLWPRPLNAINAIVRKLHKERDIHSGYSLGSSDIKEAEGRFLVGNDPLIAKHFDDSEKEAHVRQAE